MVREQTRRRVLALFGSSLVAGCMGSDGATTGTTASSAPSPTASSSTRPASATAAGTGTAADTETATEPPPEPSSLPVPDGEWSQIRGSAGNHGATTDAGPGDDVALAWFRNLPRDDTNYESYGPTVTAETLVALGVRWGSDDSSSEPGLYLHAHDRTSGEHRWSAVVAATSADSVHRYYSCADADTVYVCWNEKRDGRYRLQLTAFDAADGEKRFANRYGGNSIAAPLALSPDGETVYTRVDTRLHALSTADGTPRWSNDDAEMRSLVPALSRRLVVYHREAGAQDVLVARSADDGTVRWTTEFEASVVGNLPVVANDTVYVAGFDGQSGPNQKAESAQVVHAFGLADGKRRWSFGLPNEVNPETGGGVQTVATTDDAVYFGVNFPAYTERNGGVDESYTGPNVFSLDPQDGTVRWKTRVGTAAHVFNPPTAGEDYLYVPHSPADRETDPRLYVLDRTDGEELASVAYPPASTDTGHLSVVGGHCYAIDGETVYAYE